MARTVLLILFSTLLSLGSSKICDCLCGQQNIGTRIINGTRSAPNRYPWMTAIADKRDSPSHFCGGTLINSRWILTAAHCVYKSKPEEIVVVLGAVMKTNLDTKKVVNVEEIVLHKGWHEMTGSVRKHDIALLKMSESVAFTRDVSPACLPREGFPAFNNFGSLSLLAVGWGVNMIDGPEGDYLFEAEFNEMPNEVCSKMYPTLIEKDNVICITAPGKDSCIGDSGAPLTTNYEGSSYVVGLTSWGVDCKGTYVTSYTRITTYLKWIRQNAYEGDFCRNPIIPDMG